MAESRALFSDEFARLYAKLDLQTRKTVDKRIRKILEKPALGKPLGGRLHGLMSERVDNLRILYEVSGGTVIFRTIGHRKSIYR
jgi:mRNA-degrading endonuclease RelE of RelBE toxin-antitoxin system